MGRETGRLDVNQINRQIYRHVSKYYCIVLPNFPASRMWKPIKTRLSRV